MLWTLAFWLLVLYLTNSALGLIRALLDKGWYEDRVIRRGVAPNRNRLMATKAITLTCGTFIACWPGAKAGYL